MVFCPNTNFLDIDVPSPPRNLNYSIESYGTSSCSVRIQWEAPTELGGVEISSYVCSKYYATRDENQSTERSVTSSLIYNYEYEVNITAENCNGSSKVTSTTITKGEAEIGTCNKRIYISSHLLVIPLLLPMVLLSPTTVLRWGQRSSTTVMRATPQRVEDITVPVEWNMGT